MLATTNRATAGPDRAGGGILADLPSPVAFTMPTPPSVNKLFKNVFGQGRVKTSKYDDYIRCAVAAIRAQGVRSVKGNILALFGVERPDLNSDIDNRLKGGIDAIVKAGVISDDKFITGFAATWLPKANGLTHVILMPVQQIGIEFHPAKNGASGSWIIAPATPGDDDGDLAIQSQDHDGVATASHPDLRQRRRRQDDA